MQLSGASAIADQKKKIPTLICVEKGGLARNGKKEKERMQSIRWKHQLPEEQNMLAQARSSKSH